MSLRNRGQVAIEVMFILAIILTGTLLIVRSYYSSSSGVSVTYQVRTALDDACSYLNTGVVVEDSVHSDLNTVIELNNYTSLNCAVTGLRVYMNSSAIVVRANLTYSGSLNSTLIESAVRGYLIKRLSQVSGYSLNGGVLYFRGIPVKIEVRVE